MKKVVLAFSGGLDTSYCAIYLAKNLGYEVHSVAVNTGGFDAEEVDDLAAKSSTSSASKPPVLTATECTSYPRFFAK